jgi:ATP-dependent exoDNAse (exonuclease V) beta subunit
VERVKGPGLVLFSAGAAWESAFQGALEFLGNNPEGKLLLGPGIGESGREWIEDHVLGRNAVLFGTRILKWNEWVEARARDFSLSQGKGFRPLNPAAKREQLRIVAEALSGSEAFHHLQDIWKEERFFSGLVDCVSEARKAGLTQVQAIGRARELLSSGSDPVTREAYEDFWKLLELYEGFLSGEDTRLDEASLLRLAAEAAPEGALYLLGFDRLSLLECELLQKLAREVEVVLPLSLPDGVLSALLAEKAEAFLDHPAALSLRALLTGYSGKRELLPVSKTENGRRRIRLLEAHSPSEEARGAAALGRVALGEFAELRYLVPANYFSDRSVSAPFREELALPANFHARTALLHPVARLFFHVLSLKEKDYALAYGLELGQLLEFTLGEYKDLASRAARAGVRKGLADWKRKAGSDRDLQDFGVFLEKIDRALPEKGSAGDFAAAVEKIAGWVGLGELARRAPNLETEREAHAALAAVLRNAQMLASSTRQERPFTFGEWMGELKVALEGSQVGEVLSLFPRVQFYRYGEWLPPAGEKTLTLALGLNAGVEPSTGFSFYFEEGARRKLAEFALPTQVQSGLCFLDQMARATKNGGTMLLSFCRHDGSGKELEPSWVASAVDTEKAHWPEASREITLQPFRALEEVRVEDPGLQTYSASLFELYKECPFKAFAEKVLRLEDKVQESTLDLSRLEEGSFVHKTLELFYGKHRGKEIIEVAKRESVLDLCLEEAKTGTEETPGLKREYFKGNEALLASQLERLKRLLLEFLRLDAENYSRFPFFGQPQLEKEVGGMLGGKYAWKGKIDRLDIDEANRKFLVTDYKIGASPPANAEVNELKRFQLQLYLSAVREEHPELDPAGGVYASLATGERGTGLLRKDFNAGKKDAPGAVKYFEVGGRSTALHEPAEFSDLLSRSQEEALRLAGQIEAGQFPVRPLDEEKSCQRCSVRPACRVRDLRSPPAEPWARPAPEVFTALLESASAAEESRKKTRAFNPEQEDALTRKGALVFIEAAAGTGKTTVIVERVRRFLAERIQQEPAYLAVERFAAISFTEKSTQELGARLSLSLLQDEAFGPRVAAQAQAQVSTIHGFCRKVLADFPVEAGVSPLAAMLDAKSADLLLRETVEDFFLFPDEPVAALFAQVFAVFSRAKVEGILLRILEGRALFAEEIRSFRAGEGSERLFPEGGAREILLALLDLADCLVVAYETRKRASNVLDFNDLEALALKVLEHPHAREFYRKKFELLLVDEFQDTNALQRKILEGIARPEWSNLFVVGDAKQSIYRFRAADVSVFQGLRREAQAKNRLVTLSRNYRSRSEIVSVANRITAAILPASGEAAPDFEAVDSPAQAELPAGGKVALVEYGATDQKWTAGERRAAEARQVAALVSELRAREHPPKKIALLLRKFSGNEAYLRALTEAGIHFRVGASKGFYGQSVVTDGIALLRVLYGAKNDLALLALLRSPWVRMSDTQLVKIRERKEKYNALWDKLEETEAASLFAWKQLATHSSLAGMLETAYAFYPMGRREHLQAVKLIGIVDKLEREAKPRQEILDLLSSWSGWDQENESSDEAMMPEPSGAGSVQVMTVHAAKGLEFDVTILADLCGKPLGDNSALRMVRGVGMVLKLEDEETNDAYTEIGRRNGERELAELKRLFYVAATRAQAEEYFFLPRSFAAEDPKKWSSCAHFLRAADLNGLVEKIDGDARFATVKRKEESSEKKKEGVWPSVPAFPRFRSSSITEIADFKACPEFHRLKKVQAWDDRIVALWPKSKAGFRKQTRKKNIPRDPESERVAKLLKGLKIERKERGIALHRVLERVQDIAIDSASARLWLQEAYEAQGVRADEPLLTQLLEIDLKQLQTFLSSASGKEFFHREAKSFPEIPFHWKVGGVVLHGAIDRLIRKPDGSWIVVDYKSSVKEESLDDYRFQVAAYMAAVEELGLASTGKRFTVAGYLVDLFSSAAVKVDPESGDTKDQVARQLEKTAGNYTLTDNELSFEKRGVKASDHCLTCPYSDHCDLGKEFVAKNL